MEQIKGGLIVSCQALEGEALHGAHIMARMALAAKEGGACGIRANSPEDIKKIKEMVRLPVIGLLKQIHTDSEVYITPTLEAVEALMEAEPDIIAMDATARIRPGGISLDTFFREVKSRFPDMVFMADCATFEEAKTAEKLGFDLAGTTLCGYTKDTETIKLPAFGLMRRMAAELGIPVIGEGGIGTPEELREAFDMGIHAAVVGTAITRPAAITKKFADALKGREV